MEKNVYIAPNATVVGQVSLQENVNIWYGAVLRGDYGRICIGKGTNIQDNCVIHDATVIGEGCTVGHGAIVHGCTVGDSCLIGMGAIVLNGAVLGDHCLVGAGAVVTGKMNAPSSSLLLGNPAKIVRQLSAQEMADLEADAAEYIRYAEGSLPKSE